MNTEPMCKAIICRDYIINQVPFKWSEFQSMKIETAIFQVLLLVCSLHGSYGACGDRMERTICRNFSEIRVRTNSFDTVPKDSFFRIALKTCDPEMKNFVRVQPEPSFKFKMVFFCMKDNPGFCVMYDMKGHICGVQIAIPIEDVFDVTSSIYDYAGVTELVQTEIFDVRVYAARIYLTNPEMLTSAGRRDICVAGDGVWVYIKGKLVEIDRCQPNGPKLGSFYMQGCYPRVGQLFINDFNRYTTCNTLFGMFLQYDLGSLVGFGMYFPGIGRPGIGRDWYEHPSDPKTLKMVIPDPPPCFSDLMQFGATTVHVYTGEAPWTIGCPHCVCKKCSKPAPIIIYK